MDSSAETRGQPLLEKLKVPRHKGQLGLLVSSLSNLKAKRVSEASQPNSPTPTLVGTWEVPDDGHRDAHDAGFGIKMLKHKGSSSRTIPDKLLEYATEELENRPWAILFEETRKASVVALPIVWRSILYCMSVAVGSMFMSLLFEDNVMTVFSAVNSTVSGVGCRRHDPCAAHPDVYVTLHARSATC